MNRTHIIIAGLILFEILLLFMGCHDGSGDPIAPVPHPGIDQTLSDEVADTTVLRNASATPSLWGYYRVTYDSSTHMIAAVPVRATQDAWNVVTFMQPPKGSATSMNVSILDDSEFLSTGRIDVRVMLHHPFPGQSYYTGFDVCGIFITEGSVVAPHNSHLRHARQGVDPILLNPDGYTRWMNPEEFLSGDVFGYEPGFWGTSESSENSGFVASATLNPYKYFSHGLAPDQPISNWLTNPESIDERGMFPCGSSSARDYELQFPVVGGRILFVFNYAILANWIEPMVEPVTNPLSDFPPEANAGWPLHIFATDNSQVFYTPQNAGGNLSFELEIFDWDALTSPDGVPGEVGKFVVWSDEPLVPGQSVEFMSTEVEWNSGFTASTSVATIEISGAVPEDDGDHEVWVAIESTNPSSYNQGYGANVPTDPLAAYIHIPVDVKNCPKAWIDDFDTNIMGTGSYLDDVIINGEDIAQGSELGVWLENIEVGGSTGEYDGYTVIGTDVKYIDANTISADFDFTGAPVGDYCVGCSNGCGVITSPEENYERDNSIRMKVVPKSPWEIYLTTGRTSQLPSPITSLYVFWNAISDADYYNVYVTCYDVYGSVLNSSLVGATEETELKIELGELPVTDSGIIEVWITAVQMKNSSEYESLPSRSTYMYFQGFETGMGNWSVRAEVDAYTRFLRSTVDAAYSGMWGLKLYGMVPYYPDLWILLSSPEIPEVEGAGTVKLEFVHKHRDVYHTNGYQVGFCDYLPEDGAPSVENYTPVTEAAYGWGYNDDECTALQTEFGISPEQDMNFQTDSTDYQGWYLSGFNVPGVLGDNKSNYLVLGFAGNSYDVVEVAIDEIAILIY
jgi:hypothetical protein